MRLTPIRMPAGTPIAAASTNAPNTRAALHNRCSDNGRPPWMWPCHASTNAAHTASGAGRNSGGNHCRCVATHHSTASAATVAALKAAVLPCPGNR